MGLLLKSLSTTLLIRHAGLLAVLHASNAVLEPQANLWDAARGEIPLHWGILLGNLIATPGAVRTQSSGWWGWYRLPKGAVDAPSLEMHKARLGGNTFHSRDLELDDQGLL